MTNLSIKQSEPKISSWQADNNEIDSNIDLRQQTEPSQISDEIRQERLAVINVAIFVLLWGGTVVAASMTSYAWYIKASIILIAFPVWGYFINSFVISWMSPVTKSDKSHDNFLIH